MAVCSEAVVVVVRSDMAGKVQGYNSACPAMVESLGKDPQRNAVLDKVHHHP